MHVHRPSSPISNLGLKPDSPPAPSTPKTPPTAPPPCHTYAGGLKQIFKEATCSLRGSRKRRWERKAWEQGRLHAVYKVVVGSRCPGVKFVLCICAWELYTNIHQLTFLDFPRYFPILLLLHVVDYYFLPNIRQVMCA